MPKREDLEILAWREGECTEKCPTCLRVRIWRESSAENEKQDRRTGEDPVIVVVSKSALSLCPGYHPVTQFRPDNDYEEEEIFYITLELSNIELSLIPRCNSCHLVGLGTPTPSLQLAGTALKGRHKTLYGPAVRRSWSRGILHNEHMAASLFQRSAPRGEG
ncbi:hypothetical protein IW261DRAFT_1608994 [Armillaria novae-zelandiae]|uniref:Transcription factor TFIIIC triple barrel domain-containing protein n=1 Tax=Armillaria novae-zelandiae TaxID=153914 RepID=A0AA39P4Z2_9AGAR|nr:hypothetical protein IW261DRAFT_1608994 [Armillaria novae-zelandiae]